MKKPVKHPLGLIPLENVLEGNLDHYDDDTRPDWSKECEVCSQRPIVPVTGMCGPCTFGEADTVGGNW